MVMRSEKERENKYKYELSEWTPGPMYSKQYYTFRFTAVYSGTLELLSAHNMPTFPLVSTDHVHYTQAGRLRAFEMMYHTQQRKLEITVGENHEFEI